MFSGCSGGSERSSGSTNPFPFVFASHGLIVFERVGGDGWDGAVVTEVAERGGGWGGGN